MKQASNIPSVSPLSALLHCKKKIETRRCWNRLDKQNDFFESSWKPQSWDERHRFVFVRQQVKVQYKQPVQLDLFIPYEYGYTFKVILTNMKMIAVKVVVFLNDHGSQDDIFAELKSQNQLGYVPTITWRGNQVYQLSAVLAHNLSRELQMITDRPSCKTQEKRPALWDFEQLNMLRQRVIQRAGRLIRPQGRLTLSKSANRSVQNKLLHYSNVIENAA